MPQQTRPSATTDHYNATPAMRAAALRFVDLDLNIAYAQEIQYADPRFPLEGQLKVVGDWERVYPREGDFYKTMVPFLSPLFNSSTGAMITDPDTYKTLRDNNEITPEALGLEIATVELVRHGLYSVVMLVDKLPADDGTIDPSKILVGSYGA